MALAALELTKRSPSMIVSDPGYYNFGGRTFRSHEGGLGALDMHRAIQFSSNTYFYSLAVDMGVDAIHDFMKPLGFGQITGIDIPGEVRGILPSQDWKRNYFKRPEQKKWFAGETISLGIGQGYNSFTMLQLAHATATIANHGVRHVPRLVTAVQDAIHHQKQELPAPPGMDLGYKPEHIDVVQDGLAAVVTEGTATRIFAGAPYTSAGKTGTAQAVTIAAKDKYNAAKLAEHQRDHALYMAYAPLEDPRIALAVIVENAGWGAAQAAPIARRVFDYWIAGLYPSEDDLAAMRLGQATAPIGRQRPVADVPGPGAQ